MKRISLLVGVWACLALQNATAQHTRSKDRLFIMMKEKARLRSPEPAAPGSSLAKTTSPLRLTAIVRHDASPGTTSDTTYYTHSGGRGWGTDEPYLFDQSVCMEDDGTGLVNRRRISRNFNAKDSVVTETTEDWYDGAWQNDARLYNDWDVANARLTRQLNEKWDTGKLGWNKSEQIDNQYNSAGKLITVNVGEYDPVTGARTDSFKITLTYNTSGLLQTLLGQQWESGAWEHRGEVAHTYDLAPGLALLRTTYGHWEGGIRILDSQEAFDYGASGRETNHLFQVWDDVRNAWRNKHEIITRYTLSGNKYAVLFTQWDDDGKCDTVQIRDFVYNSDNLMAFSMNYKMNDTAGITPLFYTTYYYEDHAVSVSEIATASELQFKWFPNPSGTMFYASYQLHYPAQLYVTDLQGKLLLRQNLPPGAGQCSIDAGDWPAGVYLYRLGATNGASLSGKLVRY